MGHGLHDQTPVDPEFLGQQIGHAIRELGWPLSGVAESPAIPVPCRAGTLMQPSIFSIWIIGGAAILS